MGNLLFGDGIKSTVGALSLVVALLSGIVLILWLMMGGAALLVLTLALSHGAVGLFFLFIGSIWTARMMQMGSQMSAPAHAKGTETAKMYRAAITHYGRLQSEMNDTNQTAPLPRLPEFTDDDELPKLTIDSM